MGSCQHLQVRALRGGAQESPGCRPATSCEDVEMIEPNALEGWAVEILAQRQSGLDARLHKVTVQTVEAMDRTGIRNSNGSGVPVELRSARLECLNRLERRQHLCPAPSADTVARPAIIVAGLAAHPKHP